MWQAMTQCFIPKRVYKVELKRLTLVVMKDDQLSKIETYHSQLNSLGNAFKDKSKREREEIQDS